MRMSTEPVARVLVIDPDENVCADLVEILEPQGFEVEFVNAFGYTLLEAAERQAKRLRPHVIILELRLLGDYSDELTGLRLAAKLRSARNIVYSAHLTPKIMARALTEFGVTNAIGKQDSPQHLVEVVTDAANQICDWRVAHCLQYAGNWSSEKIVQALFEDEEKVPPDMANDVLFQLFGMHQQVKLKSLVTDFDPTVTKARRHSVVMAAQRDGLLPVIVKLAPSRQIEDEIRQYESYVHGQLQGMFHPVLESTPILFWDLGGAVYSFLGAVKITNFTNYYLKETDPDRIVRPLRHFFTEVWSEHYAPTRRQELDYPLFELYDAVHELADRLGTERRFPHRDAERHFDGLDHPLPNPVHWLPDHTADSQIPGAQLAVTHGDLHGDNLFVDSEHAWAIDFERTGSGHILRDFVELELDIVTRLTRWTEDDLPLLYALMKALVAPDAPDAPLPVTDLLRADPRTQKALDVIARLRALALEVTDYSDFREYLWGLLLHTLFVASLTSLNEVRRERVSLLSAVICERLQQWA